MEFVNLPVMLDPDGYDLCLDSGMTGVSAASELMAYVFDRRMRN
jgi:hypothetical protein